MDDFLEVFGVFVPNQDVQELGCLVVITWVVVAYDCDEHMIEGIDVLLFVFDEERLAVLEL